MSTPRDPWDEAPGSYNPYGQQQQGAYRAGQQPGQYSSGPLQGQPYPAYDSSGPSVGFEPAGYNPYGSRPAGRGEPEPPATRPAIMIVGFVLLVLATLPWLIGGVVGLISSDLQQVVDQMLANPQFAQAGATPELIVSLVRTVSVVLLFFAVLFLVFAFVAFTGRNWARIVVTILSVGFALLLLAALVTGASSGATLGFAAFELIALVIGVVALYRPESSRFFARER